MNQDLKKLINETVKNFFDENEVDVYGSGELPPSGEEKYEKQEPGGTMSATNLTPLIYETNFRIYNETLCPDLWDAYDHLDGHIRVNLLRMAYDFYEKTDFKAPIVDVYLMGSIANYNWTPESDVDIHIIIDHDKLQMPSDTILSAIKAACSLWNNEHHVAVKRHKVEMNIQNMKEVKPHVTGIYSLVKDQWVRKPVLQSLSFDKTFIQSMYKGMKEYLKSAINSGNRHAMKAVKKYIDAFRQYGLDTRGELSVENIVFKILRAKGLIEMLKTAITMTYDKEMTVREAEKLNESKEPESAIEDLMEEHGVVSRCLLIYEELIRKLETEKEMSFDIVHDIAEVIRHHVEDHHEKVEEKYVFALFKGKDKLGKVVKILTEQHKAGRKLTGKILNLSSKSYSKETQNQLFQECKKFVHMYGPHKAWEDTVVFPAVRKALTDNELEKFNEKMEEAEKEGDPKKFIQEVEKIEKKLGIYKICCFTPEKDRKTMLEVRQQDIKSHLPSPENIKLIDGQKLDLSRLTLDHLKALRAKAVRFWKAASKKKDHEETLWALAEFERYNFEIKRRMRYINAPLITEESKKFPPFTLVFDSSDVAKGAVKIMLGNEWFGNIYKPLEGWGEYTGKWIFNAASKEAMKMKFPAKGYNSPGELLRDLKKWYSQRFITEKQEVFDIKGPDELSPRNQVELDQLVRNSENIISGKELYYIYLVNDHVAGALYTSYRDRVYSFNVVVSKEYRQKGIGVRMIRDGLDEYFNNILETDPDAKLELNIVNPSIIDYLKRIGMEVEKSVGGRVIMFYSKGKESSIDENGGGGIGYFSKELEADIQHLITTSEDSIESGEPVLTRAQAIRYLMQDMDDPGHYSHEHRRELQNFGVKIGIFEPCTREELDNIVVIGGRGRKYDFKRGNLYYRFNSWKPLIGHEDPVDENNEDLKSDFDLAEQGDTVSVVRRAIEKLGGMENFKAWFMGWISKEKIPYRQIDSSGQSHTVEFFARKYLKGEIDLRRISEGYGAGIPGTDKRLGIPGERWRIRSKDAPKTPKMPSDEELSITIDLDEIVDSTLELLFESPNMETLKKNRKTLSDEERRIVMDSGAVWHHSPNGKETPGVWKSIVKGKTWYVCNTHRAYQCKPTLRGAIKAFEFIETTS
jgi:hemerythrin-like domain-containing protein/predicted nucleotidyltransferase/ribosomal protein S18 acetylase RimI-like enzyme